MSLTITLIDPSATKSAKSKQIELPAEIFDVQTNIPLIHQVVNAQRAAARQGTQSTKHRGEVRGGGKKPYRQKGTGRARQGSTRAPQFVGGGVVHGPKPRDYSQRTPKKMKVAALRGALSDRARYDRIHVVSSLVDGDVPSAKLASETLSMIATSKHVLVVAERDDVLSWKSLRNLDAVHLLEPGQLNTYDVLISDDVVFTEAALATFVAGPPTGKSAKASASSDELADTEIAAIPEVDDEPADEPKAKPAKVATKAAAANVAEPVADDAVEVAEDGPDYGPDSHLPIDDDAEPEGYPIKGNASSKFYHVPGSPFYNRTIAEVWFKTAEAAEAAGFQLPPSQRNEEEQS
jgi:large subunit ribosomal protein L4